MFYNRLLRCFVLFDLKIGKLTHQDIGQMQMYVNYYDRKIKLPDERPTIGIILCKEENRTVIEFTLPEDNKQIFAKEYKSVLPSKEELRKQLEYYLPLSLHYSSHEVCIFSSRQRDIIYHYKVVAKARQNIWSGQENLNS